MVYLLSVYLLYFTVKKIQGTNASVHSNPVPGTSSARIASPSRFGARVNSAPSVGSCLFSSVCFHFCLFFKNVFFVDFCYQHFAMIFFFDFCFHSLSGVSLVFMGIIYRVDQRQTAHHSKFTI